MRLSPIVLSTAARLVCLGGTMGHDDKILADSFGETVSYEAMMIAAAVAGVSTGTTTTSHPQLSTEFFLVPSQQPDKNNLASVASVVSVPAPNRTISIYQTPRFPLEDSRMPGHPVLTATTTTGLHHQHSILRQRSWALPLAALSAAAMLIMAAFEIFVLLKVLPHPFHGVYTYKTSLIYVLLPLTTGARAN